jgi:hypothetical protein
MPAPLMANRAAEMLLDVKRLLGSLYEEYDYEFDPAWVSIFDRVI